MKKSILIALSMLVCMSASLVLTACGGDEPGGNTMTQKFVVMGDFTVQDGTFVGGYAAGNDDTPEFKFYEGIYKEVKEIVKPQVWEISFKADEKDQKIKEQNAVAEQRFTEMSRALDAVQKKLDQTNKDTYKCHFSMTIKMVAAGEYEIRSGQKTVKYVGNE